MPPIERSSGATRRWRRPVSSILICLAALGPARALATPALTMDFATGDVLYAHDATRLWSPASTTKLMTVYVALSAVRDHKIAMNTPLVVSARAHKMPPAHMGFPAGTQVTLENALKMLMVESPNDIAVTIAEGVAGSVEAFADDMNRAAAHLGMHESHFVNPNGLSAPDHHVSARDLALVARALLIEFPDEAKLFDIGELALGKKRIQNTNSLLGRYPGMDGMKTGFTCAAGWNLVATAFRGGRRLIVVVLGGPTADLRNEMVVDLLDRGFAGIDQPHGSILGLPASTPAAPPDLHDQACAKDGPVTADFAAEVAQLDAPLSSSASIAALANPDNAPLAPVGAAPNTGVAARIAALPAPVFTPLAVRIGADPGYHGVVAQPRAPHAPLGTATKPMTADAAAKKRPGKRRDAGGDGKTATPAKMPHDAAAKVKKPNAS